MKRNLVYNLAASVIILLMITVAGIFEEFTLNELYIGGAMALAGQYVSILFVSVFRNVDTKD